MSSTPTGDVSAVLERRLGSIDGVALSRDEPLAPRTTLRIGGPAELFVGVRTEPALVQMLDLLVEYVVPWRLLGLGSNVLIPDQGLTGVTAVLEGDFLDLSFQGSVVEAGAALPLARVARAAAQEGWAGLEALAGFPSTVGGAVIMNAGCFGVEIKDVLAFARVVRPGSEPQRLEIGDLQAGYRTTNLLGSDAVVTRAAFHLRLDPEGEALKRLQELNRKRRSSMPLGRPNAGSVFKNPPGDYAGRMIEACGLKGQRVGGAEISVEHANVIVNDAGAAAEDVLSLMLRMHRAVRDEFQTELEPELILCGSLADRWVDLLREQS